MTSFHIHVRQLRLQMNVIDFRFWKYIIIKYYIGWRHIL